MYQADGRECDCGGTMPYLIINADDFGLSPGVCKGIIEAMQRGVVTASSAMVCSPDADAIVSEFAPPIMGRLGLHLQLTKGTPCLPPEEIPTLVGPDGKFPGSVENLTTCDTDEVLREFRAQWRRLRNLGIEASHLDTHHHAHKLPNVFPAYCRLALELGIPARGLGAAHTLAMRHQGILTADLFMNQWYKENLHADHLLRLLKQTFAVVGPDGVVELMTHPGYADQTLTHSSSYSVHRELELQCLCSEEIAQGLKSMGVERCSHTMLVRRNKLWARPKSAPQ